MLKLIESLDMERLLFSLTSSSATERQAKRLAARLAEMINEVRVIFALLRADELFDV